MWRPFSTKVLNQIIVSYDLEHFRNVWLSFLWSVVGGRTTVYIPGKSLCLDIVCRPLKLLTVESINNQPVTLENIWRREAKVF